MDEYIEGTNAVISSVPYLPGHPGPDPAWHAAEAWLADVAASRRIVMERGEDNVNVAPHFPRSTIPDPDRFAAMLGQLGTVTRKPEQEGESGRWYVYEVLVGLSHPGMGVSA
jgi:hypothetical protein